MVLFQSEHTHTLAVFRTTTEDVTVDVTSTHATVILLAAYASQGIATCRSNMCNIAYVLLSV